MKHISSFILSIMIHTFLIIIAVTLYFFIQNRLEASKMKHEKPLCINIKNYKTVPNSSMKEVKKKVANTTLQKQKIKSQVKKIKKKIQKPKPKKSKPKKRQKIQKSAKKTKISKDLNDKKSNKNKTNKFLHEKQKKQIGTRKKTSTKKMQRDLSTHVQMSTNKEKDYSTKYFSQTSHLIRKLIAKNLYYPRKARKRHIQGTVQVRFLLTTSGKIENIEIVSPSPQILANAVKKTLKRIEGQIPPPRENVQISLPVVYTLLE